MTQKIRMTVGERFGRLTVVGIPSIGRMVLCYCDCGKTISTRRSGLVNGHCQSCGCLMRERVRDRFIKHGLSQNERGRRPRIYQVWTDMINRCSHNVQWTYKKQTTMGRRVGDFK